MGGVPARFIMKTEDYAAKLKKNTINLPWINESEIRNVDAIRMQKIKKEYYFKMLKDEEI